MVNSEMKDKDSRIKDNMKRNGDDEKSILMRKKYIMGRVMKKKESRVLNKVLLKFIKEWDVIL
jgi:hypothetical protein